MKKIVYIALGIFFLSLGFIGIIIPILPTVKFLVIASICFMKGSQRFNRWFKQSYIYQKYCEEFVETKTLSWKQKVHILAGATLLISIPLVLIDVHIMKVILGCIIIIKSYIIVFAIKTKEV